MKKLILILTIPLLMGASCEKNDNKPIVSKRQSQTITFEKKQECASYKDKIKEEVDNYYREDMIIDELEISYSPKRDSCIYYIKGTFYYLVNGEKDLMYTIWDYFENKEIYYSSCEYPNESLDNCNKKEMAAKEELKTLKGENK